MPMNSGVKGASTEDVTVEIRYDTDYRPIGSDQPLVNVNGYCMTVENPNGYTGKVRIADAADVVLEFDIDPGWVNLTVEDLQARGFATRGDVANIELTITD